LGWPAPVDVVGEGELTGLVEHLERDVLAEVLQRHLHPGLVADRPDLVGPARELEVVRHAALHGDGLPLRAARRLAAAARVTALAVLDHLGRALERADLADRGHVPAVPLETELEVLVRVEALLVDRELRHGGLLPQVWIWPASCSIWMITNSAGLRGAKP